MKTFIALLFSLCAFSAFSQDTTYTLPSDQYGWHQTDTKSWVFDIVPDTIDASSDDDTIVINLPHNFGNLFTCLIETTMDTTAGTADLEGTYELRGAQCTSCPYTTLKTITIPNVDVFTRDTLADIRDIKLQVRIIGTSGVGTNPSWITLKPK